MQLEEGFRDWFDNVSYHKEALYVNGYNSNDGYCPSRIKTQGRRMATSWERRVG